MNTSIKEETLTKLRKGEKKLGILSVIFGAVGWFAAFQLLTEYVKSLQIEDYVPNCSFSVLVSCSPNMASWQGSLFGFSNTIIGVAAFVAPVIMGIALLAGVRFPRWWWHTYNTGLLLGFVFVCWLAYQSIFSLHTLCPWCMVVWLVMIPLLWVTVSHVYGNSESSNRFWREVYSFRWIVVVFFYVLIATVAQLKLDWFAELSG